MPVRYFSYLRFHPYILVVLLLFFGALLGIGSLLMLQYFKSNQDLEVNKIEQSQEFISRELAQTSTNDPEFFVYRNSIYGFVFIVPASAYIEVTDNTYSEFGEKLGYSVPYVGMNLAKKGQILLSVWHQSQLNRLLNEYPNARLLTAPAFSPDLLRDQSDAVSIFRSKDYLVVIDSRLRLDEGDDIGEVFGKSFRLVGPSIEPDRTYWFEKQTDNYSFIYPRDWSVLEEEDSESVSVFSTTEYEGREERIPGYGLSSSRTLSFQYHDQTLEEWLALKLTNKAQQYGVSYEVFEQDAEQLGENTIHTIKVCNSEEDFSKGAVIEPGSSCEILTAIASNSSSKLIELMTKSDLNRDHYNFGSGPGQYFIDESIIEDYFFEKYTLDNETADKSILETISFIE